MSVCPWHGEVDVSSGAMVEGPARFLGYHGPTPRYTQLVLGYSKVSGCGWHVPYDAVPT